MPAVGPVQSMSSERTCRRGEAAWFLCCWALLVGLGGFVRLWALRDFPNTLWVDEAWFAHRASAALQDPRFFAPPLKFGLGVGDAPLHVALTAIVQALGLEAAYSARVASSIAGTLAVALMPLAAFHVLEDVPLSSTHRAWSALAATVIQAFAFTSVYFSRDGGQNAMSGCFGLAVLWALHLATSRSRRLDAVFCGVLLAASQTVYEANRLFPLVALLYGMLRLRSPVGLTRRQIITQLAVTGLVATVLYAPLGLWYFRHPDSFLHHIADVSIGKSGSGFLDTLDTLWGNTRAVLLGISVAGDPMPGRNLAGRPLFDPLTSAFFWVGISWAWLKARQSQGIQLLSLWALVLAAAALFSEQAPSFGRLQPQFPALFMLGGLGWVVVFKWVWRAPEQSWARVAGGIVVLGAFLAGTAYSLYDLFVVYSRDPRIFDARYYGARATAEKALELARTSDVYLIPKSDPLLTYQFDLLLGTSPIVRLDADPCLPLVDESVRPTTYGVVDVISGDVFEALQSSYPSGRVMDSVMHPDGYAYALFFGVPAFTPAPRPQKELEIQFEDGLKLMGFDLGSDQSAPGGAIVLDLYWASVTTPANDYTAFVHVVQGWGEDDRLVAASDAPPCGQDYPTSEWSSGKVIVDRRVLAIEPDAPPGDYLVEIGAYVPQAPTRLKVLRTRAPVLDDRVSLALIQIK